MKAYKYKVTVSLVLIGYFGFAHGQKINMDEGSLYSSIKPKVIQLHLPSEDDGIGGVIAADVNDDGLKDFIVTKRNHIVVYDNSGKKLWRKIIDIQVTLRAELDGLPGWHAPGVQTADVDGDGRTEVLYLVQEGALHILQGSNGQEKWKLQLRPPAGAERWEHLVVANFRGYGDHDLLLQATNARGFRRGRYLVAYALVDLKKGDLKRLWERDDFVSSAHSGARVADLDGDGKDEVLGGTVVGPDGRIVFKIPLKGQIDAILVADIRPDVFGLEVIALEEGGRGRILPYSNRLFRTVNLFYKRLFPSGNRTLLYNHDQLIWETHFQHREPHNAVVGDFDTSRRGLEVWCRSRHKRQAPFVFDSQGQLISHYVMKDVAPTNWTSTGIDAVWTIDWTGGAKQLAAAKERRRSGDVTIFDPISGRFLHRFRTQADRIYVADVYGDWREELIILNGNQLHIYENDKANPNPNRPRLWDQNHYRRNKMTWNYYNS
jgi:hypothetical protein